jgi:hypothetical protein
MRIAGYRPNSRVDEWLARLRAAAEPGRSTQSQGAGQAARSESDKQKQNSMTIPVNPLADISSFLEVIHLLITRTEKVQVEDGSTHTKSLGVTLLRSFFHWQKEKELKLNRSTKGSVAQGKAWPFDLVRGDMRSIDIQEKEKRKGEDSIIFSGLIPKPINVAPRGTKDEVKELTEAVCAVYGGDESMGLWRTKPAIWVSKDRVQRQLTLTLLEEAARDARGSPACRGVAFGRGGPSPKSPGTSMARRSIRSKRVQAGRSAKGTWPIRSRSGWRAEPRVEGEASGT